MHMEMGRGDTLAPCHENGVARPGVPGAFARHMQSQSEAPVLHGLLEFLLHFSNCSVQS